MRSFESAHEAHHFATLGLDDESGGLAVKRVAQGVQLREPRELVGAAQEWAVAVVTDAAVQRRRFGVKIYHRSVVAQARAVARAQYRTATRRQHDVRHAGEVREHHLFAVAD